MKKEKMQNIRLLLAYDGGCFGGWQRVDNGHKPSIQATLEHVLSASLDVAGTLPVIGSGRTDAGVHAWGQVANVHVPAAAWHSRTPEEWRDHWNGQLPEGLRIRRVEEVAPDFHSRYDALGKTYAYLFDLREVPDVFARKYTWAPAAGLPGGISLDLAAMERAARYLTGEHDFIAFASKMEPGRGTVRRIDRLELIPMKYDADGKPGLLRMEVTGNGFLYHMVRILAGTLFEVGTGKRTPEDVKRALECSGRQSGSRADTGRMLPAEGLVLLEVRYAE